MDLRGWVRFLCTVVGTAMVLMSCGGSSGGSRDAFCSSADEFVTQEEAPSAEQADRLGELADDAPDEVADEAEILAQVADRLSEDGGAGEIDPDDPTASLDWLRDLDLDAADVARAAERGAGLRDERVRRGHRRRRSRRAGDDGGAMRAPTPGRRRPATTHRVVLVVAAACGMLATALPSRASVAQEPAPDTVAQELLDQRMGDLAEMADDTVAPGVATGLETPVPGQRPSSAEVPPQPTPPAPSTDDTIDQADFAYLDQILDSGSVPRGLVDELTDEQLDALVAATIDTGDLLGDEPAAIDPLAPVPPGEPTLPPGDYTPSSTEVENPDGSTTATVSTSDRFVQTDEGWTAFDPAVVETPSDPGVVGQVETSIGVVEFGDDPSDLVRIVTDDGELTLGTDALDLTRPPEVRGDQVTYTDGGVSVAYQAVPNGMKELVVLDGPDAVRRLTFRVDDPDGVLGDARAMEDGSWRFVAPDTDRVLAVIPSPAGHDATAVGPDGVVDPLAWDVDAADLDVVAADGGFDLTLTIDEGWLAGRTYPVSIDPTLVLQTATGQGPSVEGFAADGGPCPSGGCTFVDGTFYGFLSTGRTGGATAMAISRWNLWDDSYLSPNRLLPPRAVVDSAAYSIPTAGCFDLASTTACLNTASVDIYELTGEWSTTDNFSTIAGLQASTPATSNPSLLIDPNEFDVTDLVQTWADDPDANFGMTVRAPPVASGDAGGYYHASKGLSTDPTLEIEWHPSTPGTPQNLSFDVIDDVDGTFDVETDWDETVTGTWSNAYLALLFKRTEIEYYLEHPSSPVPTPQAAQETFLDEGDDTSATFADVPPGDYTFVVATQNGSLETTSAFIHGIEVGERPTVDVEVLPLSGATASLAPGDGAQVNVTVTNPNDDPLVSDIMIELDEGLAAVDEFFATDDDLLTVVRCGVAAALGDCTWSPDPGRIVEVTDLELPATGDGPVSRTISFLVQATSSELACASAVISHHITLDRFLPVEEPPNDLEVCGNGLGLEPWWSYVGRPVGPAATATVNVANGNLVVQQDNSTSVQGHGRQGYVLRSTYNSQTPPLTAVGAFGSIGAGWTLNVSTAGETAGLITPTGLSVPSLSAALPQLTAPLATVLVDRDGTRHLFTPHSIEANVVASLHDQGDLDELLDSNPLTNVATGVMSDADFRGLGTILDDILPPTGTGPRLNLCVDTIYEAPRGVHLSMWRFIGVQSPTGTGCESTQGANGIVSLGYATMRPDRVRQVFSATGQLVSQFDGAGNELRYRYALDLPSTLMDAQDALDGALDGITGIDLGLELGDIPLVAGLTLGPLMAIYEPGVCEEGGVDPFGLVRTGVGGECNRSMTFDYAPFSLGIGIDGVSITVTDPAHRTIQYDTTGLLAPRLVLTTVRDGDGAELETWEYGYGADEECGGQQLQLCSITAPFDADDSDGIAANDSLETESNQTTQFDYVGEQTLLAPAPSLTEITERPVASATIAGASTNAHTFFDYGSGETLATRGVRGTQFGTIDDFGRVHVEQQGTSNGTALDGGQPQHRRVWDGDVISSAVQRCQFPAALSGNPDSDLDHHLCRETRHAFAGDFTGEPSGWEDHDRVASFTYNPIGQTTSQTVENGSVDLVTTMGYDIQYRTAGGTADTESDAPAGSGGVTRGDRHDGYLYAVSDLVSTLSPRGNTRSTWAPFLAEIEVDADPGVHPNVPIDDGVCGSSDPHNTGLVCSQTGPEVNGVDTGSAYTSASDDPHTTFTYDTYGQLTVSRSARANDTGDEMFAEGVTRYRYYEDDEVDLSGDVNAGGWLASIHDTAQYSVGSGFPTGHFVAFTYDRAGNPVRTWDRDATSRNFDEDGTTPAVYRDLEDSTSVPPDYTEELHGLGDMTNAVENPWRYVREQSDQLRNRTLFTLDDRGNPWEITPPRGVQSGGTSLDVQQAFDARDRLLSTLMPEERAQALTGADWSYQYDEAGNMVTATDPNDHVTAQDYDPVSRQTRVRFTRGDPGDVFTPPDCDADDGRLPSGRIYCEASVAYDGLDQVVNQTDPDGGTTWNAFDAAGRTVSTFTERNENGITWARAASVLDADGNALVSCRPRQFTEGSSGCTTSSVYASHRSFDPAGHLLTERTYRNPGSPNESSDYRYDHDGNTVEIEDPNTTVTRQQFNLEGRLRHSITPRSNVELPGFNAARDLVTSRRYSPAGDLIEVQHPDGDWGVGTFDWDTRGGTSDDPDDDIFSLYSYDAAHRLVDSVEAAPSADAMTTGLPNDPTVNDEAADTSTTLARAENLRTRRVYDVDGNVIAVYEPRAFYDALGENPIADPEEAFMTRIDWDRNGRPIAQWQPYWDGRSGHTTWSPIFDTSTDPERVECPEANAGAYQPDELPGAPTFPSDVGVCVTRVSYDPAGNLRSVRNPSSGTYSGSPSHPDSSSVAGDSGNQDRPGSTGDFRYPNRFELRTYTDDNLLRVVNRPNPAYSNNEGWRDGDYDGAADADPEVDPRVDVTATDFDGSGRWLAVENLQARFRTTASYTPDGLVDVQQGERDDNDDPEDETWVAEHRSETDFNADGQGVVARAQVQFATADTTAVVDTTTSLFYADGLLHETTQDPDRGGSGPDVTHAYQYDDIGNATVITDPMGRQTLQDYTEDNLLASTSIPVLPSKPRETSYTYDPLGRKRTQSVCGPNGLSSEAIVCDTQSMTVNRNGSLLRQTGYDGETIDYRWHADGSPFQVLDSESHVTTTSYQYLNGWTRSVIDTGTSMTPGSGGGSPSFQDHQTDFAHFGDGVLRARYYRDETSPISTIATTGASDGEVEQTNTSAVTDARQAELFTVWNYFWDTPPALPGVRLVSWERLHDQAGRVRWEAAGDLDDPPGFAPNPSSTTSSSPTTLPPSSPVPTDTTLDIRSFEVNTWNEDGTIAERAVFDRPEDESGSVDLAVWTYDYDGLNRQALNDDPAIPNPFDEVEEKPIIDGQEDCPHAQCYDRSGEHDTFDYEYDGAGRLSSVSNNGNPQGVEYDLAGVRTLYGNVRYTTRSDNSIAKACADVSLPGTDDCQTYRYDGFGRMRRDGCRTYTYDGFDRNTAIGNLSSPSAACGSSTPPATTYAYDGLDRQIHRTETGEPAAGLYYLGESSNLLREDTGDLETEVAYYLDEHGAVQATQSDGDPAGPPIGHVRFLHDDGHGNVALAVDDEDHPSDPEEAVTCSVRYDPWGNTRPRNTPIAANNNPNRDGPAPNACEENVDARTDVLYRDTRRDESSGNYQWGSRAYDPDDASWLTPDVTRGPASVSDTSIGADPLTQNRYSYVNGDPINAADPTGHRPEECGFDPSCGNGETESPPRGHVTPSGPDETQDEADQRAYDRWLQERVDQYWNRDRSQLGVGPGGLWLAVPRVSIVVRRTSTRRAIPLDCSAARVPQQPDRA